MGSLVEPSHSLLELWVNEFADDLFSWAYYKTNDKEIAKDLIQDTFFAATKGIDKFKGESKGKTWLFSILNNKIADHHKKKFKQQEAGIIEGNDMSTYFDEKGQWHDRSIPTSWEDDEHLLDNSDFNITMAKCMSALPGSWEGAISMKYHSEKKGEEICQELGISKTNYWQILHRAKLQLRSCLDTNWFNKIQSI